MIWAVAWLFVLIVPVTKVAHREAVRQAQMPIRFQQPILESPRLTPIILKTKLSEVRP